VSIPVQRRHGAATHMFLAVHGNVLTFKRFAAV
jgi:hypothetical protein